MKKTILKLSALSIIAITTFTSCSKDEEKTAVTTTPTAKNIVEIAQADTSLSILVAALTKAGLVSTLQGAGTFTAFAPNNDAFRAIGTTIDTINAIKDEDEIAGLKAVLLYHVLGTKVTSGQLTNTYVSTLSPINGNGMSLQINIAPVKFNNKASVVTADINASNGVIHKINTVLIPPTVVDIAKNNSDFSTLVSALVKAELVETLEELEVGTVFAPVNKAFTDINFDLSKTSKEDLAPILTAHVLGTSVLSSQIKNGDKVTTLNKAVELTFNTSAGVKFNGGTTNDITVTTANIQALNGVVHVINKVIIPGK